MDVEQPTKTLKCVPELWFEDGNIILQAGQSQFRLFKGILAARSAVFHDMLSLPQPADEALVQGCAVVELHDDETDAIIFLKAMFLPWYLPPFPRKTTFDIISSCLRLSHKYEVEYIRREALVHLSSGYCTTLADIDRVYASAPNPSLLQTCSWKVPTPTPSFEDIVKTIRIAVEVDALWVLPNAFLDLCCALEQPDELGRFVSPEAGIRLPQDYHMAFFRGFSSQARARNTIYSFLANAGNTSVDIPNCAPNFSNIKCQRTRLWATDVFDQHVRQLGPHPVYAPGAVSWDLMTKHMCKECIAALKTRYQSARQTYWDTLPESFGLASWAKLETMKETAIGTDPLS
ncbi:hypothetical protein C8F01DRAFT_1057447 [Mycena amicta]|nr:hypothetical protein C8F01DRAFT_1057447 [Mycena amicta]